MSLSKKTLEEIMSLLGSNGDLTQDERAEISQVVNEIAARKTQMEKQAALGEIATLVASAKETLQKAAEIAKEHSVEFTWDGPGYGMGGWYNSQGWNSSNC